MEKILGMLFSYFNVDRRTELKYRKSKVRMTRINKRSLEVLSKDRVRRYREALSVEDDVNGVLSDCVEAVCNLDMTKEFIPEEKISEVVKEKKTPQVVKAKKRGQSHL